MSEIRRRLLLLGPAIAVVGVLVGGIALESTRLVHHTFPGFLFWDNGTLVSFHQDSWTGPRAGLPLNGGRLRILDGEPFVGGQSALEHVAARPAGSLIRYRVVHEGETRDYAVASMVLSPASYALTFGIYLLNGLAFLTIAFVALALRPELAGARALALASGCMGLLVTLAIDYFSAYRLVPAYLMVEGLTPAALWTFVLSFPVPRGSPGLRRALGLGLAVVGAALAVTSYAVYYTDPEISRAITYAIYVAVGLSALAMVVSFADAFLRAPSPVARTQASVVFAGGLVALVLPGIAVLAFFTLGWTLSASWIAVLLPLFPLSVLYAIVRHDLLGVERFVRLTTGYVLSTSAVVLVYAVLALAVERGIGEGAAESPLLAIVLLVGIAVGFDPLRRRVQDLVDRIFYRTQVDVAGFLEAIGAELAGVSSEEEILRLVERRCRDELNVEWVRFARQAPRPGEAALVEPVRYLEKALGSLACGSKRSGAPFAERERELLRGLAAQTALALENAHSLEKLRQAQEMLIRSERLAAIGEFAGSVAHGIRNPLSGIRATAQAALEDDPEERAAALDAILHETDRVDQRIQALLDFSRPFDPRPRRVDLRAMLGDVSRAFERRARRQSVEVRVETGSEPLGVETDADYLEEVLLELVGNALRVVPEGGRITLEASAREDGGCAIRVRDTGPGVPEGLRERIFELFYTTRSGGTGLGLATVRKIVGRLGGSVVLERSGAEGSVFRIDLPGLRA